MANRFRLSDHDVIGFLATSEPERAREFYGEKLALRIIEEHLPFALVYDAHGTMPRVTIVKKFHPAGHTVLGWKVPDIITAARDLAAAGLNFERYPGMEHDELGIWTSPGGDRWPGSKTLTAIR